MLDTAALRSWLQPQYLETDVRALERGRFLSHPLRAVRLRNLLDAEVAARLSRFLSCEAAFEARCVLRDMKQVTEQQWWSTPIEDRFYVVRILKGVKPEFKLTPNLATYISFRNALSTRAFIDFFTELTGFALGRADLNPRAMMTGDYVAEHIDDHENRRVAFALYLSPGWLPENGGALELLSPGRGVNRFEAEYNSMVLFDATIGTLHRVTPVGETAGGCCRVSLGGWFSATGDAARSEPPQVARSTGA